MHLDLKYLMATDNEPQWEVSLPSQGVLAGCCKPYQLECLQCLKHLLLDSVPPHRFLAQAWVF